MASELSEAHKPLRIMPELLPVGTHLQARLLVAVLTVAISTLLLFARLGHYAFWDDEAVNALIAKGITRTGDTSALVDGNLVAYRGGLVLRDLKDRATPPLGSYLTAISFALFGESATAGRLPFALAGMVCVAVLIYWFYRCTRTTTELLIFSTALLGNVSFFLYSRQCRYYAICMLLSVIIARLYLSTPGTVRAALALAAGFVLLFASHSLTCVAVSACLFVDYILWRRRELSLTPTVAVAFFLPQLLGVAAISAVWNPFRTAFGEYVASNSIADRFTLWWWQWRDMNQCEFLSATGLILAIAVAAVTNDAWLRRGLVALFVFVSLVTLLSPQLMAVTSVADVRYLCAALPLCIFLSSRAIWLTCRSTPLLALTLAAVMFGSNLCNAGPLLWCGLRSTIGCYIGELIRPPTEPFTPTARWVRDHIAKGESVWVLPDTATYPLMFHAPDARYAWQLPEIRPEFSGLDPIHFRGRIPPDYIILFGPYRGELAGLMQTWRENGADYRLADEIPVFWKDLYRPELFWRTFVTVEPSKSRYEAIYIFRRHEVR